MRLVSRVARLRVFCVLGVRGAVLRPIVGVSAREEGSLGGVYFLVWAGF